MSRDPAKDLRTHISFAEQENRHRSIYLSLVQARRVADHIENLERLLGYAVTSKRTGFNIPDHWLPDAQYALRYDVSNGECEHAWYASLNPAKDVCAKCGELRPTILARPTQETSHSPSEPLASNVLLAKAYLTDAHAILKSACSKEGAGFDLAAAAYKVVEAIRLLESGAAPEPQPIASKVVERMGAANAFESPATANLWLAQGIREIARLQRANADLLRRNLVLSTTHEPCARQLVEQQAKDDGLWFEATNAAEAYLQQELRKLHAAIEGEQIEFKRPSPPPPVALSTEYKIGDRVNHCGHITEVVGVSVKYMLCGGAIVLGCDLQPALTKRSEQP